MRVAQVLCLCSVFIVSAAKECVGDSSCIAEEHDQDSLIQSTIQRHEEQADDTKQDTDDSEHAVKVRDEDHFTREELAQRFCQHCYFNGHITQMQMKKCHRTSLWKRQPDVFLTSAPRRRAPGGGTCWSPSYGPNSPRANFILFDDKKMSGEKQLCGCWLKLVQQCYNKPEEAGYKSRIACANEQICNCPSACTDFKQQSLGCKAKPALVETKETSNASKDKGGSSLDETLNDKCV